MTATRAAARRSRQNVQTDTTARPAALGTARSVASCGGALVADVNELLARAVGPACGPALWAVAAHFPTSGALCSGRSRTDNISRAACWPRRWGRGARALAGRHCRASVPQTCAPEADALCNERPQCVFRPKRPGGVRSDALESGRGAGAEIRADKLSPGAGSMRGGGVTSPLGRDPRPGNAGVTASGGAAARQRMAARCRCSRLVGRLRTASRVYECADYALRKNWMSSGGADCRGRWVHGEPQRLSHSAREPSVDRLHLRAECIKALSCLAILLCAAPEPRSSSERAGLPDGLAMRISRRIEVAPGPAHGGVRCESIGTTCKFMCTHLRKRARVRM